MAPARSLRTYQIVIWGSTGLVGRLISKHIAKHYQVRMCYHWEELVKGCAKPISKPMVSKDKVVLVQGQIKWAMAGRNLQKLEKERDTLAKEFPATKDTPLLTGDATDLDSLRKIASQTKVLISTSGPFATIGSNVVEACVLSDTHYCDITGDFAARSLPQTHNDLLPCQCALFNTHSVSEIDHQQRCSISANHAASQCCGETYCQQALSPMLISCHCFTTSDQVVCVICRRGALGHAYDEGPPCRSSSQGHQDSPLLWL